MAYSGFDLTGRSAVVLGGTSGIGRALVDGLLEAGADVAASSRQQAQVDATALAIEQQGRKALRVAADVTDRASLQSLCEAAVEAFGKVDILVNCAGRTRRRPTLEVDEDEWQGILDTNLTGTLRACQVFGAHMLERGYGRIVNIASGAARAARAKGDEPLARTYYRQLLEVAAASAERPALEEARRATHAP